MSDAPDKKLRTAANWASEGLLLALIPVIAYAVALEYEHGMCGYFGIPTEVVELSSWTVIGFTLGMLVGLTGLLLFLNAVGTLLLSSSLGHIFARFHPALRLRWGGLLLLVVVVAWSRSSRVLIGVLAVFVFCLVFDVIVPILGRRGRPVLEAINEREETEIHTITRPIDLLPQKLMWLPFLLFLSWIALAVAEDAGRSAAARTTRFCCFTIGSEQWVILRIYRDSAFCGALAPESNQLNGRYRAVPLAGQAWEERTIGPLTRHKE